MGSSMVKVAPLPGWLSAYIRPPCSDTMPWQMLKPSQMRPQGMNVLPDLQEVALDYAKLLLEIVFESELFAT